MLANAFIEQKKKNKVQSCLISFYKIRRSIWIDKIIRGHLEKFLWEERVKYFHTFSILTEKLVLIIFASDILQAIYM